MKWEMGEFGECEEIQYIGTKGVLVAEGSSMNGGPL